jgi:DMSO/TMAO reductase YedYZ molybdopterin-dependent catalytic subunit
MKLSRRQLIRGGLWTAAGASGLAVATVFADRSGLLPPDSKGIYAPGEALTYAAHRLLTRNSMAREFRRDQISKKPFANATDPPGPLYERLKAGGFVDWRLTVDGLVARPMSLTLPELREFPSRSQITHLACEEGWSYIAEWTGVPLSHVLNVAGVLPDAKYVAYFSTSADWWDSVDLADAYHPQTLLAYGLNGGELPIGNGGPLRMRVPRQLGYKSVKYITRLTVTDSLKKFGKGLGSAAPEAGYAWYAGI